MKEPVDWFSEGFDWKSLSALGPHRNLGILSLEKKDKNLLCHSGCVTNWYQSMVTTLGLLGLMNELRRSFVWNTPKRSNPYINLPNQKMKLRMKNPYCVCVHVKI